jgi:Holliday junction resolvase RusA-like endonuclease
MIKLTIPGVPVAKQRARVTRRGFAFTPAKTVHYETYVRELFAVQYPDFEPLTGPVVLRLWAYFPVPKGTSRRIRQLMESGFIKRDKRPDVDNLLKIFADSMNGLAYADDGQIASASIEKLYSGRPRVEVELEKVEKLDREAKDGAGRALDASADGLEYAGKGICRRQ